MPSPLLPSLIATTGAQRRQRRIRFEQAPPQRAQAAERIAPFRHRPQIRCAGPLRSVAIRHPAAGSIRPLPAPARAAPLPRSGSISFAAAASGGAIIDCEAISGVAGGGWPDWLRRDRRQPWSRAVVATGATTGASGLRPGWRFGGCGGRRGGGAFCRAIEPVTESRPCSSTVTREYSRSRSLLSVSMAEASRRASFWLSLATDGVAAPAAPDRRRRPGPDANRKRRLVGEHGHDHRGDRADAPRPEPPQRRAGRIRPPRPKNRSASRRCFRSRSHHARWSGFLAMRRFGPPGACKPNESRQTLSGNTPRPQCRPLLG